MTEYSYVISVDEYQLSQLDDKIRKLEELSGEAMSIEGLSERLNDILSSTGIPSGTDKDSQSIEEITNNITSIKATVNSIYWNIDALNRKFDPDRLAEVMVNLAKEEFTGGVMGTRQIYESLSNIEELVTGKVTLSTPAEPTSYDVGKLASDMQTISVMGGMTLDTLTADIMEDLRKKAKFENFFTDVNVDTKYLDMLLEGGPEAEKEFTKEMKGVQNELTAIDRAFKANSAELARMTTKEYSGIYGTYQPNYEDPENPWYMAKLNPDDWPKRKSQSKVEAAKRKEVDDYNIWLAETGAGVRQRGEDISEKYVASTGLPPGGHLALRWEMVKVSEDIVNRLEQMIGDELDDTLKEGLMTNISEALAAGFNLNKKGGYTTGEITDIVDFTNMMSWNNTSDLIRGIASNIIGTEEDPAKVLGFTEMIGPAIEMWLSANMASIQERIESGEIRIGDLVGGTTPTEPVAPLVEQVALDELVTGTAPTPEEKTVSSVTQVASITDIGKVIRESGVGDIKVKDSDLGYTIAEMHNQLGIMSQHIDEFPHFLEDVQKGVKEIIDILREHGIIVEDDIDFSHSVGGKRKRGKQ